jgi:hypothetical protein
MTRACPNRVSIRIVNFEDGAVLASGSWLLMPAVSQIVAADSSANADKSSAEGQK